MRKRVFGRKLSRGKKRREALFRSLIRAVVLEGKVVTTQAKVGAVKAQIDKLVTLAKEGSLASRRRALSYLGNDRKVTANLFGPIAKIFFSRKGGYTRTIPLPPRRGDAAKMARLEWTEEIVASQESKSKKDENVSTKSKRD